MQNQYSLVFHKAYRADLLPKAGFSSVDLRFGVPQVWGALEAACCVPLTLPGALLPLETSVQGIWEVLFGSSSSTIPEIHPPSRCMVTEHFVKCPELTSTRRAPGTLPALPSTRTLLLPRKFPFPCCFSTPLSRAGFSL